MVFKVGGAAACYFPKKMSATILCPRRSYIELFCVEQKAKIIINNTWDIPFHRTKKNVN